MTITDPALAATPPIAKPPWESCDSCGSPVDDQQRFCVVCGAHQRRADDPAARWFASARRPKPAAAPAGGTRAKGTVPTLVAAGLIALLPVAAGVGILVGRGTTNSNDEALLAALKAQQASAAAAPAAAATTAQAATPTEADAAAAVKDTAADAKDDPTKIETATKPAKILATGPTGSARQLEGSKPTKKDLEESKAAVKQINSSKGDEYVDSQRNLPDQIVVP